MRRQVQWLVMMSVMMLAGAASAGAQTPAAPPPPPGWTGSFGAGLAQTRGNSDTSTLNAAYEVKRDAGSPFLFKSTGLFIRGSAEGELVTNRLLIDARADRKIGTYTSVFGQVQYLRDEFKRIDYLVSPTLGVAQQLVKNARTSLAVDAGVGVVRERNPGLDTRTSGAVTAAQSFSQKLTATAELTQRASALWKMEDFDDALYIFGAGVAANLTKATQMKVELLNTFKSKPPSAAVQRQDLALLVSFVYRY
jgi:putative salt-induced outer membrane protein YdiY